MGNSRAAPQPRRGRAVKSNATELSREKM